MLYKNTNAMPKHADGTVLHLGVKEGQGAFGALELSEMGLIRKMRALLTLPRYVCCVRVAAVANRVVSVGSLDRAKLLAALLDDGAFATYESSRGFTIYTGEMQSVAVSIVATGMVRWPLNDLHTQTHIHAVFFTCAWLIDRCSLEWLRRARRTWTLWSVRRARS